MEKRTIANRVLSVLFVCFIAFNGALAAESLIAADEPIKCPDGAKDCTTVETPNHTWVFHKGNPVSTIGNN